MDVLPPPLTKFRYFRRLPTELRLRIWHLKYVMDEEELKDTQRLVEITYDEKTRSTIALSPPPVLLLVSHETRNEFLQYYSITPNKRGAAKIYVQYDKDLVWVREDSLGFRTKSGSLLEDIFGRWPLDTGLEYLAIDYHILHATQATEDIDDDLCTEKLQPLLSVTETLSEINIIVDKECSRYERWGRRLDTRNHNKKTHRYPLKSASEFSFLGSWSEDSAFWSKIMWKQNDNPYPLDCSSVDNLWKMPRALLDALGYLLGIGGNHPDIEVDLYARDGKKSPCSCDYCGPRKYVQIQRGEEENDQGQIDEGTEMENLGVCQRLRLPGVKDSYEGVGKEKYEAYKGEKSVKPRFVKDPDTLSWY